MKKITDEYANEALEPILFKYIEDENIIELHNSVIEKDEDLMPLAMFFAQRIDITKMLDILSKDEMNIEKLEKAGNDLQKDLMENKDLIENIAKIAEFNDPKIGKLIEAISEE